MTFLPDDYKPPAASGGNYVKFAPGKTIMRIIGDSTAGTTITGWEGWTEDDGKRQPHRSREQPPTGRFEDKPKHFWAFLVWSQEAGRVQICEITQRGIQDALRELKDDDAWGDLKHYDVCIQRNGEGLETSYTVIPQPKAQLPAEAIEVIKESIPKINLAALYDGEDPFAAMAPQQTNDDDPFGT